MVTFFHARFPCLVSINYVSHTRFYYRGSRAEWNECDSIIWRRWNADCKINTWRRRFRCLPVLCWALKCFETAHKQPVAVPTRPFGWKPWVISKLLKMRPTTFRCSTQVVEVHYFPCPGPETAGGGCLTPALTTLAVIHRVPRIRSINVFTTFDKALNKAE